MAATIRMNSEVRERLSRFLQERSTNPKHEWTIVERRIGNPGSLARQERFAQERDAMHGKGRWKVGYDWENRFIPEDEAIEQFFNASYRMYMARNPQLVDTLCNLARELTDSSAKLRGEPLWEVDAIRAALKHLGRKLEGKSLLDLGIQNGLSDSLKASRVPFLGGIERYTLEQFWIGEQRCLAILR